MIVKVVIPDDPNQAQAYLSSEDKKVSMHCPIGLMQRRLGESKVGFFKAEYDNGIIELGDRVPDEKW